MSNRWLDDDEIDSSNSSRGKSFNRWRDEDDDFEDFDPNKDYFGQVVEKKETNILESTERSLKMLEESERIGAATAEELVRQGEVLRRTEGRVDKMEQDLKASDRHLRSIKSVWGAFMNKFVKEPEPPTELSTDNNREHSPAESLGKTIDSINVAEDKRLQVEDSYDPYSRTQASSTSSAPTSSRSQQVDQNLDLMGNSLARLKQLGLGLQDELEAQDPMLDRLQSKVIRVDDKMHSTNKEMLKIYHS
jgi:synaptosomal-associated protein 29